MMSDLILTKTEQRERIETLTTLLTRLRQWDQLVMGTGDEPYWRREIDAVIGVTNEKENGMSEHQYDAWEVGVHSVPAECPLYNISLGTVVIHDLTTDAWEMIPTAQFDRDYEWA